MIDIVAALQKLHSAVSHMNAMLPQTAGVSNLLRQAGADIDGLVQKYTPDAEAVSDDLMAGADVAAEDVGKVEGEAETVASDIEQEFEPVVEKVEAVLGKKSPAAAAAAAKKS